MRLIVAGGRDYRLSKPDKRLLSFLLRGLGSTQVLHGGCRGVDSDADALAGGLSIPTRRFPADWTRGRSAGPIRNAAMVREADGLVTFPGGRGTSDVKARATAAGLPVWEIGATP